MDDNADVEWMEMSVVDFLVCLSVILTRFEVKLGGWNSSNLTFNFVVLCHIGKGK
jgi:hypothetical protein